MKVLGVASQALLIAGVARAIPGVHRRQNSGTSDTCTCPTNGPLTTTIVPVTTSTLTITIQGGTVTSTGTTTTEVITSSFTSTFSVVTGTTTITSPGVTSTTTATSTTTNTVTVTATQTTCTAVASRKVKRQTVTTSAITTTNSPPSQVTTVFTINSQPATCTCRYVPATTSVFPSSSSCSCPATTGTITVTASSTSTITVTQTATTSATVIITPSATSTSTVTQVVTISVLETTTTTQSDLTITSRPIETDVVTVTATTITCESSSTTSTSASASATVPLVCNSTAYLIGTLNNNPTLYNIDLATSYYFVVNGRVGNGAYTAINAMGYNTLDDYLYAIAQPSAGINAVLRISATGVTQEISRFAQTNPPTAGDVDQNGQFWITAAGGTEWRHIDLAPGSSTYGRTIANGTTTLSGYGVYDFVFLPGQPGYFFSLAQSTASNPTLTLLRFNEATHVWNVNQTTTTAASNPIIANWGARNATLWGLAANSGNVSRLDLGRQPRFIGTAPGTLSYADGARCALSVD